MTQDIVIFLAPLGQRTIACLVHLVISPFPIVPPLAFDIVLVQN